MANVAGQYRYGDSVAINEITPIITYKNVAMSGDSTDSTSFVDFQISPAGNQFIQDHDYYLKLQIPQDLNYALNFDIQLTKQEGSANDTYQHIKTVSITRGGSGENSYTVLLYEDTNGEVKAMIPHEYIAGQAGIKDEIYYQESTGFYFICNGGTSYSRWSKYNSIVAIASWREDTTVNYGLFEMVFTPIDSGFTHIYVKLIRTAEDYNIQRVQDDGSVEFGRKVDISLVRATIYSLNNLVENITTTGMLNRIGVWGHPSQMMAVNGEEIRISRSGHYELDDFPIERLCVVAPPNSYDNFFTIDYTYEDAEG